MKARTHSKVFFATFLYILMSTLAFAQNDSTTSASAIINQFQLDEADSPISDHPAWAPQKILITEHPSFGSSAQEIRDRARETAGDIEVIFASAAEIQSSPELLKGADAILGMCNPQLLAMADDSLVWVHNYFVGVENCASSDPAHIQNRVFTNPQRLSSPSIAEHAIALMMPLARNFPAMMDAQRQQSWARGVSGQLTFGEIAGKTMLVAGLGGIGTEVARRAHGLGMRVIATRNSSRTGPDFVEYVGLSDELNTLAAEADVVVNALPFTDKTSGIFNQEFFEAIKTGAIYINVGRGRTTDTDALIDALESGKLYGAGLDVTDPEPLPENSPLWKMNNVIVTPHVAFAGGSSIERSKEIVLENLRRYIAGEALLNPVDLNQGY